MTSFVAPPRGERLGVGGLNLTWITPHLAVGGGFPESAAERLAREHGVRAIVDLRAEACDDEAVLQRHGMTLLHLPTEDHVAVSPPMLDEGVAFAAKHMARGERVLVHCQEGVGRSALLALCVLVDQGLPPVDALKTAKDARWQVSPNPAQYEAWAEWLSRRSLSAPDFETFAFIAYRHLAQG